MLGVRKQLTVMFGCPKSVSSDVECPQDVNSDVLNVQVHYGLECVYCVMSCLWQ